MQNNPNNGVNLTAQSDALLWPPSQKTLGGRLRKTLELYMEKEFANNFVSEWFEAWNSHDLDKIMSHYSDDFEMNSPVITQIINEKSGKLKGKTAVRVDWEKALNMNPSLHFEFIKCFLGANSRIIHCRHVAPSVMQTLEVLEKYDPESPPKGDEVVWHVFPHIEVPIFFIEIMYSKSSR